MNSNREKSPWLTPALIVMSRHRPEEAVLVTCKFGLPTTAPNGQQGGCGLQPADFPVGCGVCEEIQAS